MSNNSSNYNMSWLELFHNFFQTFCQLLDFRALMTDFLVFFLLLESILLLFKATVFPVNIYGFMR